uniref:C-type lectin domain-containing protein n=1 Tax=Poecilia mexicana TaxID=48701 RepID=A0A3B3X230_9TELE
MVLLMLWVCLMHSKSLLYQSCFACYVSCWCCTACSQRVTMEKKHMHVQHSRLSNSASLRSCRESRFHLSVILFFGVFSICLLIGLLVTNAQYNDAKRQLTEDLQALKKTHASTVSEINKLNITLDEKSKELSRALSAQNSNSECHSSDELLNYLTDRLLACNESLFNLTKQKDCLNVWPEEGSGDEEENDLSTLLKDLTACRQESEKKLSFLSKDKDLLNAKLGETTKELLRLCHLFENTTCPLGWPKFNCSCYQIFGKGSWDEGRENCTREGGDLVVINNPEEQNFLAELGVDGWIGLRETEGSWLWVDGTAPNFTSWSINQTDNGGGDEDCAHITFDAGSAWNDLPCNATKRWICEKKYQQCLLHNF